MLVSYIPDPFTCIREDCGGCKFRENCMSLVEQKEKESEREKKRKRAYEEIIKNSLGSFAFEDSYSPSVT